MTWTYKVRFAGRFKALHNTNVTDLISFYSQRVDYDINLTITKK